MSIRVNPNILPDLQSGLDQARQQLNQAVLELASGRSINQPSDNAAGTSALILNHAAQSQTDSYQQNVSDLQSKLQIADSSLNSGVTVIDQAISLGVEAGNGTLSSGDRQAIAQELSGIQQQLVGIGNTTAGGTYLFGGTQVETVPFTVDPTAAAGVTYNGNSSVTSVQIANGQSVNVNVPGDQLFLNPSGSVLGSINQLITAVQSNSGISAAVTALGTASNEFDTQRLSYGTALNELQTTGTFLTNEQLQLSTQETNIDGADIAKVATQFSQAQIAYTSLLEGEAKILNLPNILSFLQ
ncbi:MAG: flagellar hook-associated protein FlgL [Candidatus Acidiferrales bacterium]|jgi:flagellar hook-associated protein 3 FlgL